MELLIVLLGQIPEAVFISLFMIFTKNLKEKRILFTILMIVEYLLLMAIFAYNWMFHILYVIIAHLTLKLLYKRKAQITDIFLLTLTYVPMIASSALCFLLSGGNVIIGCIINRIILFVPLLILNYKLNKIQNIYKKYWNRNDAIKKKIKSITFRSLNVVLFNLLFVLINIGMLYAIVLRGGE